MPTIELPGSPYPLDGVRDLREHLEWMRLCGRADRTLECRRRTLVLLAQFLGHDPADATYEELYRWQHHLARTSLHAVRWQTALIRPFYRWLRERGQRTDNPAALLPMPRSRRGLPRPMDEAEVMDMIATAPPRLLPWLLLAGWSGLRAVQIANLRVEDFHIDHIGRAGAVVRGKGDDHYAPIPGWAWALIVEGLPASGPCWRLLRSRPGRLPRPVTPRHVSDYCNRYLHSIGITNTLHTLRHRVATLALEQSDGDLRMVQDLLGHANLATTAIYTKVRPSRVANAVEALPRPAGLTHPAGTRRLHAVAARGGTA